MTRDFSSAPTWRPLLKGAGAGIALFLAWLYGRALWSLANSTGGMDNKFSKLAREDYLSFLIGQNLIVLVAYLLLWIAAMFLIVPPLAAIVRRSPWRGRGSILIPAFLLAMLLHEYFLMRLIHSRPYFLSEGQLGSWSYGMLQAAPESWRPAIGSALFSVLPWAVLVLAGCWWIWALRTKPRLRLIAVSVALLAGASAAFAAIPRKPEIQAKHGENRPMNVIVIASDSLRGDRLGYAGYKPARADGAAAGGVSPNIDAWAQDAVRFERCYVPMASTLESAVSMMSSTYPHTNGIRHMYPDRETVEASRGLVRPIASVLKEKGYDTAAIGDWCAGFYEMMPLGFDDISVSSFDNFRIYMSQAVFMAHFVVPLYFDNPLGYEIFPQVGSFAQFVTPEVVTRRVEDKLAEQARTRARERP